MYNGQPPFRPPGNLPPFPPNFAGRPPPSFPPFPPSQGFVQPPFPPNFPPGGTPPNFGGTPPNVGANTPGNVRPPPSQSMYPPRQAHPGLGLPPLPSGLPTRPPMSAPSAASTQSPAPASTPSFVREVKATTIFVGSIAPGITDDTLRDLLNACGPLHELKRVSGASGKTQAFGFASFESPEVVMRCIRCLNGVELPDMTPEGRRDRKPAKPLVVKADEKTREFLDEFEATLGRSDDDETADAICRKAIAHIVARLTDPNAAAPTPLGQPASSGARSPIQVIVPAHLQDLKEGDLPEEQRVVVLDQIAIFRENAMRKEREKKRLEEEMERFKTMQAQGQSPAGPSDYGYGHRALTENTRKSRQWGPPQQQQQSPQQNGAARDPQGYSEPVTFVKAQAPESKEQSDRTDEEEEMLRQQRAARERDAALRDRERKVENWERKRIENLNRELAHRKQQADSEERNRKYATESLDAWDDDEKIDRGRELFYADRTRWRSQRQQQRTREYQDDVRDRQFEEDEQRALEKESEEFLKKQMAELAELEDKQRRAGLLTEDAAPIRLAMAPVIEPKKEEKKPEAAPVKPRPGLTFDNDEDDEAAIKKKRTFIKLDDAGEVDESLTEAERAAQRNARLLGIRKQIPKEKRRLWTTRIEWAAINENLVKTKIRTFVQDQMKELLGDVDEDLADFVLEQVRERKSPDDVVDGLEPVLAEEASVFVIALWRLLAFESEAYMVGLETGNMLVLSRTSSLLLPEADVKLWGRSQAFNAMGPPTVAGGEDNSEADNSFRPAKVFRDAVDANATRVSEYYPHAAPSRPQISSIAFDDSGDSCVTSGEDEAFIIWDARKGTKRKVFYSKKYGISHARFTHRVGNIIHTSTKGDDHAIRYHSTHDNRYLAYFRGHSGRVRSLQMRPIDDAFVSAGDDGTVRLWDLGTETCTGLINDLGGSVIAAYDNTGEVIAVACADTQIIMLFSKSAIDSGPFFHGRLDDPILATISQPPPKPVFTSISFSNNGHYILLGTSSDVHYVLDAYSETVLILRRLVGHRGFEYDRYGNKDVAPRRGAGGEEVGWTGDSKWVVSGSSDGSIVAWDLSPPPGQEKLLPTLDNTLHPTTTLRAADATGGPTRAVRANPRYAMLAVGGDNLSFWLPFKEEDNKAPEGW